MIVRFTSGAEARITELPGPRFRVELTKADDGRVVIGDALECDGLHVQTGKRLVYLGAIRGEFSYATRVLTGSGAVVAEIMSEGEAKRIPTKEGT